MLESPGFRRGAQTHLRSFFNSTTTSLPTNDLKKEKNS
jgi:hypothetical protein